ncbi:MAG: BolA family protein [Bdellovibrionales bacterium]
MTIQEEIESILTENFEPTYLKVINNSHLHQGHAGDDGSGNTHFCVEISTPVFKKYNRLECHRMVYKSLNKLIEGGVHALEIKVIG